jgi:glutaredoxin
VSLFIVYGKNNCLYCDKSKELLTETKSDYTYLELGISFTREELLNMAPNSKTYPQIWLFEESNNSKRYIGGYTDLVEYLENVS